MNTCIMCGAIIPEGRQVCPQCEEKVMYDGMGEIEYD
jgi:RNA polymerase subunit RPABC4/transcription elongation factor Spt4